MTTVMTTMTMGRKTPSMRTRRVLKSQTSSEKLSLIDSFSLTLTSVPGSCATSTTGVVCAVGRDQDEKTGYKRTRRIS